MIRIGTWGGSGGGNWAFIPDGRITNISIRSGSIVDAISFTFTDGSGNTYRSVNFGGNGGILHEVIALISLRGGVETPLIPVTSLIHHSRFI